MLEALQACLLAEAEVEAEAAVEEQDRHTSCRRFVLRESASRAMASC